MVLTRKQLKKKVTYALYFKPLFDWGVREYQGDPSIVIEESNNEKNIFYALDLEEPETFTDVQGNNILQIALKLRHVELITLFLDHFKFDLSHRNKINASALDYAVYNYDLTRRLIVLGSPLILKSRKLYDYPYLTTQVIRLLLLLNVKGLVFDKNLATPRCCFFEKTPEWHEIISLELYARKDTPLKEGLTLNQMCQYGLESAKLKKEIRIERQRLGLS